MRQMTMREANQQFSQLVRQVQVTGESVQVLRNGVPAAEIHPVSTRTGKCALPPDREKALKQLLESARRSTAKSDGKGFTREELHARD
ncbi:MAG: type II toxin-antitoxin system Phd/YefM family antitoxin [Alphaproteobacteria bacterium]|jgi:antitoxin (DNA-binding transcriptional repressor) of toxin-antitoxin stability system|nr:type II toxin-antitoxin system Phd/YefM family antitoxin [Alphaproteobacteria bacterium]MBN9557701.1 type II toxin-antitoxin system Phd/YefM family antitoxin [Alphaproteobacteria bacterium]MBN9577382.1 type II toxin-antitoxin system Phd/YefM family antitoxin [Alphaproteobacteria bacterium]MBN9592507.1 type II toxin-antitoxin system Phd/YefM family antitoxin [Alphaproteobacteria bacterium]